MLILLDFPDEVDLDGRGRAARAGTRPTDCQRCLGGAGGAAVRHRREGGAWAPQRGRGAGRIPMRQARAASGEWRNEFRPTRYSISAVVKWWTQSLR